MSDPSLTGYRLDKHEDKLDALQTLLTTHVDDDHDIQFEIRSDIRVIKMQVSQLIESVDTLTAKTSTTWDYVNKALGAVAFVGFLLMAFKYLGH